MTEKVTFMNWIQTGLIRICRIHFVLIGASAIYIVASDATNLITPQLVLRRWTMTAILLAGVSVIWYAARNNNVKNSNYFRWLLYSLILLDIAVATFNIYTQRGMASRAVLLYAIPIAASSVLLSRSTLFLTATLSVAAYSLAAIKYFVDFFNEGYKAELYIEVAFYCGVFYILAAILSVLVRFKENDAGLDS